MNKLILEAQPLVDLKIDSCKQQADMCDSLSQETKINKSDLYRYKDMKYYYGRGWTETSISKADPSEKFKDRVAPVFRRLYETIRICKEVNDLGILSKYLEDLRVLGIDIKISTDDINHSFNQDSLNAGIETMCHLQKDICETADELREMGPEAEEQGLCTKSRFKRLAEEYNKINKGKDLGDRLHNEITGNLLNNNGVCEILGEKE